MFLEFLPIQLGIKGYKMLKLLLFVFLSASIFSNNVSKSSLQVNYQDGPSLSSDQCLEGFSNFIFFPFIHVLKSTDDEKIINLIEEKLSKIGKVSRITLSPPYDLSIFDKGPSLCFEISSLDSIESKIPVLRASLNVATNIEIFKTHNECMTYIWSKNYFMNGDLKKQPIESISQSLDNLLKVFIDRHSLANPKQENKIHFYLFCNDTF